MAGVIVPRLAFNGKGRSYAAAEYMHVANKNADRKYFVCMRCSVSLPIANTVMRSVEDQGRIAYHIGTMASSCACARGEEMQGNGESGKTHVSSVRMDFVVTVNSWIVCDISKRRNMFM